MNRAFTLRCGGDGTPVRVLPGAFAPSVQSARARPPGAAVTGGRA